MSTAVTGCGVLLRLALRRDRGMLTAWLLAIAGTVLVTANSYRSLYPQLEARRAIAAEVAASPALSALSGPVFDVTDIGALVSWKIGAFVAVLAAVLGVLVVLRHTRGDEESGRLELLRSGRVGRQAPLAAALLLASGTQAAVAAAITLPCLAVGLNPAGSLALGLCAAATGLLFSALAALLAQQSRVSRTATATCSGVLGVAFALRAVGDSTGPAWLSWSSPIGWAQQLRPFADERWWLLLPPVLGAVLLTSAAAALQHRRDLGAALLHERPGPAHGRLGSVTALSLRLQRVSLLIWFAGFAGFGLLIGTVLPGVSDLVGGTPQLGEVLTRLGGAQGADDAFLAAMVRVMGLIAAVHAVQSVLRLRAEESGGLLEPLLAGGVSRRRWVLGELSVALGASVALLTAFGVGAGTGQLLAAPQDAATSTLSTAVTGALLQLPAVWVVAGVALLLFGTLPRFAVAGWGVLAAVLFISWVGPLLQAGPWLLDLSPFTHAPGPVGDIAWAPELWLLAVALTTASAGLLGWQRRDLG